MQAISLVQQEDGLLPSQIFEAIDFLARDSNSEVYVSLNEALRPTWLRMKLGW
jgi:3-methyladenine DNA glycosylase AlkD